MTTTTAAERSAREIMQKAITCLYIEVAEPVAEDIQKKFDALMLAHNFFVMELEVAFEARRLKIEALVASRDAWIDYAEHVKVCDIFLGGGYCLAVEELRRAANRSMGESAPRDLVGDPARFVMTIRVNGQERHALSVVHYEDIATMAGKNPDQLWTVACSNLALGQPDRILRPNEQVHVHNGSSFTVVDTSSA